MVPRWASSVVRLVAAAGLVLGGMLVLGVIRILPGQGQKAPQDGPPAAAGPCVDERAAASRAIRRFCEALLARDGATAAGLVDSRTLAWFADARRYALAADRDRLEDLGILRKLIALRLCVETTPEELEAMGPRDVLGKAISTGWLPLRPDREVDSVATRTAGAAAEADVSLAPCVRRTRLRMEEGRWRVCLADCLRIADAGLAVLAERAGRTETEFILDAVNAGAAGPSGP